MVSIINILKGRNNISRYIEIDDDIYPDNLRDINDPPNRLYYKGNLNLLYETGLAIIGTRHATEYGTKIAIKFSKEIALRDIVVVSGMALGIDRIAHSETLKVGGKTIAVMGSGFNNLYPKENINLYKEIIENDGLVLAEYEDDVKVSSSNFPRRNRIVAGLSRAVLIIEAAYRSGTSITADFAWKQGKNVYAIPGRLDSIYGVGVNKLIQNGAKIVTGVKDIISDFPDWENRNKRVVNYNMNIKKEYRKIYGIINNEPMSIDEISLKTENDVICTTKLLTLMELEDLVELKLGGYVRKYIDE